MIEIEFLGAARTVTGSMHVVHAPEARILLECGLFQGRRRESFERNRNLPFRAKDVDACVLSHAHIDHSGLLPMLHRNGYRGAIHCTPATRDLCAAMLEDSAMIQQHDAEYLNAKIARDHLDAEPIEPLYDMDDVLGTLGCMLPIPYHRRTTIAPGVELTLLDAGHVLGSAIVVLDVDDEGASRRIAFTGDLGRRGMPILRDPERPAGASFLIAESTYGNRTHGPIERTDDELAEVLQRTFDRGGKVIIPFFALERAQEIVFALKRLKRAGRMPPMPVYVDSPLTIRVTDIFKAHPDCYDAEARRVLVGGDSPFEFEGLEYVQSVDDSKRVTASKEPCVVISASGMCENGRVLHHLKAAVGGMANTVVIVGWQAQHTLGRRLVEGRTRVRIFGVERERRCEVVVLNGFSAHADRSDLVDFCEAVRESGPLRRVALVHGELESQRALKEALDERGFTEVRIPERGDRMVV
ncbi:MAG TPA: MBL fold metallo-hydrolase [Sandaracinaceae bacterium LLY-WYZ-13_1]|nr:MBL fold metallo-hydrolase [Sandaracinaceae bacterium LLY-WYZ-13_1]